MLLLAVDAWRYSDRDARQQFDLQEALSSAVDAAGTAAGLDPATWRIQEAGDGFLAVIADGAELTLIDPFVRELDNRLELFNRDRRPEARLRLRLAIHHGGALPAAYGFASDGPIHVCRLRDAKPVREALTDHPEANLVQVVSEAIFDGSVRQGLTTLRVHDFARVQVEETDKRFRSGAWIRVPGHSPARPADQAAFAIRVERGRIPEASDSSVAQAVCASFDAAGISPTEGPDDTEGVVTLSPRVTGGLLLGVWLHHLQQALAIGDCPKVSVGIAFGHNTDEARKLASEEAAMAVLGRVADANIAVVLSDEVHRRFVQGTSARLVMPDSYRKIDTHPGSWLRVLGYSIPPDAGQPASATSPVPPAPAAGPFHGPVSNIGSAVIHGSYINGTVYNGDGSPR
ncbi:hypothetical protein DMC61_28045 [Amycolatopsis sp. WAC 04169]|nr:hypothetical protein DMC61_28045 [Amycolatopsis sp. WAC 04169]